MSYWKDKVLPTIKKYFDKPSSKKKGAAEANKAFEDSKEVIIKEFEEKKVELTPKVIEIYEASAVEIKTIVKERKPAGLKKHSALVQKFLDELAKIDFPGSKHAAEASTKYGPVLVSSTVFFVFEKVSTIIPLEEKPKETAREVEAEQAPPPPPPAETGSATEATVEAEKPVVTESEVAAAVVVEETKEEIAVEKKEETPAEPAPVVEKQPEAAAKA